MPPARLPARIDRSGLGGGSIFSPAAEESVLATGAVAAATEAMLDSTWKSPQDSLWADRSLIRGRGGPLSRQTGARRATSSRSSTSRGSLFLETDTTGNGPRRTSKLEKGWTRGFGGVVVNRSDLPSQEGVAEG